MECLTKQQMTEILRKYTNLKIKDRTVETRQAGIASGQKRLETAD